MLPSPNNNNKSRRKVNFSRRTETHLVPSLSEMSDEEIALTWTNEVDNKRMKEDTIKNVKAMWCKTATRSDKGLCFRGLEHMQSSKHLEHHKNIKDQAIDAVLDEQDRQFDAGINDESKLAEAHVVISKQAQDTALALANIDAAYAGRMCRTSILEEGENCEDTPRSLSRCSIERVLDSSTYFDTKAKMPAMKKGNKNIPFNAAAGCHANQGAMHVRKFR